MQAPELPRPYRALSIATGALHSCALLEDHRVKCWGMNGLGELGLGDTEPRGVDPATMGDALPFVDLGTGRTARQIAASRYSTCAILDDGSVKCWGLGIFDESVGLVGDYPDEMGDRLAPLPFEMGRTAKALGMGEYDACAALDDDSFVCGRSGAAPVAAAAGVKPVRLFGASGVLGLFDDGSLRPISATVPPVSVLRSGISLGACTSERCCFLRAGGELACGSSTVDRTFGDWPVSLPPTLDMAMAETHDLCAIDLAGEVRCWGSLHRPLPWVAEQGNPIRVPLSAPAVQVEGGRGHHCALLGDGAVVCWNWWQDSENAAVGSSTPNDATLEPVDLGTFHPEP